MDLPSPPPSRSGWVESRTGFQGMDRPISSPLLCPGASKREGFQGMNCNIPPPRPVLGGSQPTDFPGMTTGHPSPPPRFALCALSPGSLRDRLERNTGYREEREGKKGGRTEWRLPQTRTLFSRGNTASAAHRE